MQVDQAGKGRPKMWHEVVLQIKSQLELYPSNHPAAEMHKQLLFEISLIITLFRECKFVGFNIEDKNADKIVSDAISKLSEPFEVEEFPELNPFQKLLAHLFFLYHALKIIKDVYERTLPDTLKYLEEFIYNSNDFNMLLNASRTIGRNIINKVIHPDFDNLKLHIAEQLDFLKGKRQFELENNVALNGENSYNSILTKLHELGKEMELKPSMYQGKDEESLRDLFVGLLNVNTKGVVASGETYNVNGKTDIIVKDDHSNNLLIGECKWWKGPVEFHLALNQVFNNYISWRDANIFLLFFVDNKNFSKVIQQIPAQAQNHPLHISYLGCQKETNFSFLFCHDTDNERHLKVEIMFFHFPTRTRNN